MSNWYQNARPISLPQSLLPALTAVALSYNAGGEFNWIAAIASIFGVALTHLGLNLLDDWFDYKNGSAEARQKVANEGFRGRMVKYPYLTSGEATPKQLLCAIACYMLAAAVCGLIVIWATGWNFMILAWVAAALVIGVSYSGGPLKLGFRGLGELVIFLMFGPLMMTGVYYAITGTLDWKITWLSIAVGLLVTNIVYSHSVLDSIPDAKMGKKTMAHLMGSKNGQVVLSAMMNIVPYIMVVAGVVLWLVNGSKGVDTHLHPAYLSVLVVLPLSLWLVRSLNDYVNNVEVKTEIKPWMGPMGDFEAYRKAGVDWFLLRWLVARNIVQFFCLIIIIVNFVVNILAK